MKSSLWETVLGSAPVNKDAALALSARGVHFVSNKKIVQKHWGAPPQMRPVPFNAPNMTGRKIGRLTVVGLFAETSKKGARWVVRCSCGDYETRSTKAVCNPANSLDRCQNCHHLNFLKRQQIRDRSGKWPDAAAAQDL